jgi:hypothetical protein
MSEVDEIQAVLLADPRGFIRVVTEAAREDIRNYSGHIRRHILTFQDMPCMVDELMNAFFQNQNSGTVIDCLLADAMFVRDWFPRYMSEFSKHLVPGAAKSIRLEALATTDQEVRMACWPASSFLLKPEEWTSELAAGAAFGATVAAIPAAMLTPELLESFVAFDELCAIIYMPGVEREMVLAFLRAHASYLFLRFKTRHRVKLLPFVKGFIDPCAVTLILRETSPRDVEWSSFEQFSHPSRNDTNWWPLGELDGQGRNCDRLFRFHHFMKELDWMVLPFFVKQDLHVDVIGRIASYLFVDGYSRRIRVFFKNSAEMVAGYIARCITHQANSSKQRRLYRSRNDGIA